MSWEKRDLPYPIFTYHKGKSGRFTLCLIYLSCFTSMSCNRQENKFTSKTKALVILSVLLDLQTKVG